MKLTIFPPFIARRVAFASIGILILLLGLGYIQSGMASSLVQEDSDNSTPTATEIITPTPLPGVPVEFNGEVLFYVRIGRNGLTPVERALLISRRINDLATNPFQQDIDIILAESDEGTELIAGDLNLLTVTDEDAAPLGLDRQVAAQQAADLIQSAINRSRQQDAVLARVERNAQFLIILLGLVLSYFLLHRVNLRLDRQVEAIKTDTERKGSLYKTSFYRSGFWKRWVKIGVKISKWIFFLILILIGLPFVLELFPATATLAEQIVSFLLSPLQIAWSWFIDNLDNFATILAIILVFFILNRISMYFFQELREGNISISGFDPEWALFTSRMVSILLLVLAAIIAYPFIPGSDSQAFKGISIFLGALFTLSSTAAVTNIVAGIIQTYTGAYRTGDVIRIGDVTGMVVEKKLLTTRLLTYKNEEVSIPNGNVLNSNVVNYSTLAREGKLVLYTTITIGYDAPWKKVHELLISAAQQTPDILKEPGPFVLQTSLNDYHISYQINCYTNIPERMPRIYSDLHANIQDRFNEAGVEIMSPGFTAFRHGDESTIPISYRQEPGDLIRHAGQPGSGFHPDRE